MGTALSDPYQISILVWFALEIGLAIRDLVGRAFRRGHDRGTRILVAFTLGGSVLLAAAASTIAPALDAPAFFGAVGLAVFWIGLAVRVWAVLTLGGSFRTFISVAPDQAVITSGPYRWVRHPSYTGLLLISIGIGLGFANWLSVIVCAIGPLAGLLPRIAIEEAVLARVMGEPYRRYRGRSRRLIPGVW